MYKIIKYILALIYKFYSQYLLLFNFQKFMYEYFSTWLTIHRPELFKNIQNDETFKLKQFVNIWSIRMVMVIVVFRSVQFTILAIIPPASDEHVKILLWDQMYLLQINYLCNVH